MVEPEAGAVGARARREHEREPQRIEDAVGDEEGGAQGRVQVWLVAQGLGACQRLDRDAAGGGAAAEPLGVCEVVVVEGDEQAAVRLDAGRRDLAQEAVLLDALDGRLVVAHAVAGAAVQQAVGAPRGA